jgi:hypothetical protein
MENPGLGPTKHVALTVPILPENDAALSLRSFWSMLSTSKYNWEPTTPSLRTGLDQTNTLRVVTKRPTVQLENQFKQYSIQLDLQRRIVDAGVYQLEDLFYKIDFQEDL